jgi:hypothetical protein
VSGALRAFIGVAFAAAVLYGLQRTTPGYGEITSPIPVAGKLGQRVDASAFAIGIVKVHLARAVTTKSVGRTRTFTTTGVWVLVEGAAEARSETLTLTSAEWLGPNGVRYALSQRLSATAGMLPSQRLEPGLPRPVLMAFEIPESQVAGGTLLIARSAFTPLDEQARIEMIGVRPDDIRPAVVLGRGGRGAPWTLTAE